LSRSLRASSSIRESTCLTNKTLLVRFQPRPLSRGRSSAPVERSPETRRVAGSIPAGHTFRLRSSTRESCRLLLGTVQVRLLPGPLRKDCHRCGTPSRKRVRLRPLRVRLPLLPLHSGVAERLGARLLIATRRFDSCRRSFGGRCPWRHGSLIPSRAWFESRASDAASPRGRAAVTPGSQPGSAGSSPAGGISFRVFLAVGKTDIPPASGAGDRWFDSSQPDFDAPWGNGCPASLMSSRSRFDSCRRYFVSRCGGVAQRGERSLVRREAAGSSPVVPVSWWPWCKRQAFAVVIRAASVRARPATLLRTLSIGELSRL
jgi:hypothetical protein